VTPLLVEEPFAASVGASLTAALALALVMLPLGFAPFLRARLALIVFVQAALALLAAAVLSALLKRGGFGGLDVGGWAGAELRTVDALGLMPLTFEPAGAALFLAAAIAGLVASLSSLRQLLAARTSAPAALTLGATLTFAFSCAADHFPAVAAAFAGTSLFGAGALAATRPSRDAIAGLVRMGTLHRVGDVLLCVAVFVCGRELGGLGAQHLAGSAPAIEPWARLTTGAFAGFAPRELWQLTGALVVGAATTRLLTFPLFALTRDALTPAGGIVGFVHGVTSLGCGALLLFRASAVLKLAPEANTALALGSVVTLVVASALAIAARDLRRVDLLMLVAFSALSALCASALDGAGALLATLVLVLASVPLCATGAHVATTCHTADPRKLGGLEPRIPRTHTARLLVTGALCGPLFSGAAVVVHTSAAAWIAPWVGGVIALCTIGGAALLAVAGFRVLHLTFTGTSARTELPPLKDPPLSASVPVIAAGLGALGIGILLLPMGVLRWIPRETTYRAPLAGFLEQLQVSEAPLRFHVLPQAAPPAWWAASPELLAALAVAALVVGYLVSTWLYRGGTRARFSSLTQRPALVRVTDAFAKLAGTDAGAREVGEGAVRLSRLIAVNLAPAILETALRRVPALASTLSSALVRALSSGSAQRGALFVITATAALLWWWGRP
jgi:NADH:ubiquinone oxidoreductase subunit 5 (subunit L)/multisubunit Na+/H+ antiporter MnhA subunit